MFRFNHSLFWQNSTVNTFSLAETHSALWCTRVVRWYNSTTQLWTQNCPNSPVMMLSSQVTRTESEWVRGSASSSILPFPQTNTSVFLCMVIESLWRNFYPRQQASLWWHTVGVDSFKAEFGTPQGFSTVAWLQREWCRWSPDLAQRRVAVLQYATCSLLGCE